MKRLRIDRNDDDLDGIADVDKLATWARRFIGVIGGILLAIFTWLQIREIPLADVAQNTTPEILIKTALIIY